MQYLFLNGRFIRDRSLQHALGEAYRGLLLTGRFPICFLHLDMPPALVDVNVHPDEARSPLPGRRADLQPAARHAADEVSVDRPRGRAAPPGERRLSGGDGRRRRRAAPPAASDLWEWAKRQLGPATRADDGASRRRLRRRCRHSAQRSGAAAAAPRRLAAAGRPRRRAVRDAAAATRRATRPTRSRDARRRRRTTPRRIARPPRALQIHNRYLVDRNRRRPGGHRPARAARADPVRGAARARARRRGREPAAAGARAGRPGRQRSGGRAGEPRAAGPAGRGGRAVRRRNGAGLGLSGDAREPAAGRGAPRVWSSSCSPGASGPKRATCSTSCCT